MTFSAIFRPFITGAAALALLGCTTATTPTTVADRQASAFEDSEAAERIAKDIKWLSDDARGGREAGTPGYDAAAAYVAARFDALGLTPAGDDGTYFQRVPLRSVSRDLDAAALRLTLNGETRDLTVVEDFVPSTPTNGIASDTTGELVFVGYGVEAEAFGVNDLAGVDLQGKIAVVILGSPQIDAMPSEEAAHYASSRTRRESLAKAGAIGMIGIYSDSYAERFPWERMTSERALGWSQMNWLTDDGETYNAAAGLESVVTLSPAQSAAIFEGAETSYDDVAGMIAAGERPGPFALNATATIRTGAKSVDTESDNVVAILPGSDPALRDEYVVLSAHLDHVGQRDVPEGQDGISNGAMDNAVGISTMLEVARKFTETGTAPRRSILFVAVTAEEKGLIGSEYFAVNPTVPAGSMVANVNLDMPIITYDFTDVIAFGAQHSSLEEPVRAAAESMGVALTPDPVPELVLFIRSDHYRFVQQGVPSVFLFLGFADGGQQAFETFMNTHYHRVSDEWQNGLDFNVGAKFAELNYRIARQIAGADERPTWNEDSFFGNLYGQ